MRQILFEQLRLLGANLADERNVPAYVIFSDVALREMASIYPGTRSEFRRIPGVGEQKLKAFAELFLSEIKSHLDVNPRRIFSEGGGIMFPKRRTRLTKMIRNERRI